MKIIPLLFASAIIGPVVSVPNVMLFYETLCPDCIEEMQNSVPKVLDKFGGDVFLSLVPYGNARSELLRNGTIPVQCQHGKDECTGNAWHACSHLYMGPKERVSYAMCTMTDREQVIDRLIKCTNPVMASKLKACAEGPMAAGLIKLMSDITGLAGIVYNPQQKQLDGVPTVFIDGTPIKGADTDLPLTDLICKFALEKPKQCSTKF